MDLNKGELIVTLTRPGKDSVTKHFSLPLDHPISEADFPEERLSLVDQAREIFGKAKPKLQVMQGGEVADAIVGVLNEVYVVGDAVLEKGPGSVGVEWTIQAIGDAPGTVFVAASGQPSRMLAVDNIRHAS